MKKYNKPNRITVTCERCDDEHNFPIEMPERIICRCGNILFKPHFKWSHKESKPILIPR